MSNISSFIWTISFLIIPFGLSSQYASLKDAPAFSMYGSSYLITGASLVDDLSIVNSDVKFRIGFKHRLLDKELPFGTYLYLTYQQIAFWNIYEFSSPFRELNFNPGVALGKLIQGKDSNNIGLIFLKVEHESNGKDSEYSRSWSRISLNGKFLVRNNLLFDITVWVPFGVNQETNSDLLDYVGYQKIVASYQIHPKWVMNASGALAFTDGVKGAIQASVLFRPSNNKSRNIYLQLYHGYAEELLSYKQIRTWLRLGISLRQDLFTIY